MTTIEKVLAGTDWTLLAQQKATFTNTINFLSRSAGSDEELVEHLDGLLNWIEAIQVAAQRDGSPVVWLEHEDEGQS